MYGIEDKMEQDSLIFDIKNTNKEINDGLKIVKESIDNVVAIENFTMDSNLQTSLSKCNIILHDLGAEIIVSVESEEELSVTLEGAVDNIWEAIKKLFRLIFTKIGKMFDTVSKFLKLQEARNETLAKRIDTLDDITAFTIKSAESLFKKYSKQMPLYFILGKDLVRKEDIKIYTDMVIESSFILDKSDILFKGYDKGAKDKVSFPPKFGPLSSAKDNTYSNITGIMSKTYTDETIKSNFMYGVLPDECRLLILCEKTLNSEQVVCLHNSAINLNKDLLKKVNKDSIGKLDKPSLVTMKDALVSITSSNSSLDKLKNNLNSEMEKVYKELSTKNKKTENTITTNTTVIANVIEGVVSSHVKHIKVFDSLTDDLINVYKKKSEEK